MVLGAFSKFGGTYAETAAVRKLLLHAGYSGPMANESLLFVAGGGVGVGYFTYESGAFVSLFLASRIMTSETDLSGFVHTLLRRLGARAQSQSSSTENAAERRLRETLEGGRPLAVWVDPRRLPYPGTPAGYHTLVAYGLEGESVLVSDLAPRELALPLGALTEARGGEGAPKFRAVALEAPPQGDGAPALVEGVRACLEQLREGFGPRNFQRNFGLRGLEKWALLLADGKDPRGWRRFFPVGSRLFLALTSAYEQIEHRDRQGAGLRPFFASGLRSAALLVRWPGLEEAAAAYEAAAASWRSLAAGLLPAEVPLLAKAKEVLDERRECFLAGGQEVLPEVAALSDHLSRLTDDAEGGEWLEPSAFNGLLDDLHTRVLAVKTAEEGALDILEQAVSAGPRSPAQT